MTNTNGTWTQGLAYFSGKPRNFVIDSFCPEGSVTLINGREGTGKTKLALAMAKAVAKGDFFLGQYVDKGTVAWLNLDKVFPTDLEDRARELDPSLKFVEKITWFEGELDLISPVQQKTGGTIEAWQELAIRLKGHKLIVIDTYSELLIAAGLDENNNTETAGLMSNVVKVARYTNAAIVVLHHMSKDPAQTSGRGATGAAAKVDQEYLLTGYKDKEGKWQAGNMMETLTIVVKKSRTHKIQIFPIELNALGYHLNPNMGTAGVPQGAWLGLISQRQTNLTQFQMDKKWFEQTLLSFGVRLQTNEMSLDRRILSKVLHYSPVKAESMQRMDTVIADLKNRTRLRVQPNGNNPIYQVEFEPSVIDAAMKRRARRKKKLAVIP